MKLSNFLAITLACLTLFGCGPDKSPAPKLFEEQRNALDKAKAVEATVQQQTQDLQHNVEKQTQ